MRIAIVRLSPMLALAMAACVIMSGAARADIAVLKVDFGDRIPAGAPVQSGFDVFVIDGTGTPTTRSFTGDIDVTVSDVGADATLDDRVRATPTNSGAFTESDLLRDFVFADNGLNGQGLDVLIQGLTPGGRYDGTVWSHDANVVGGVSRISDWSANGVLVKDDYELARGVPTSNADYQFGFSTRANGLGEILIEARQVGTNASVILNALQLDAVPEPGAVVLLAIGMTGLLAYAWRKRR